MYFSALKHGITTDILGTSATGVPPNDESMKDVTGITPQLAASAIPSCYLAMGQLARSSTTKRNSFVRQYTQRVITLRSPLDLAAHRRQRSQRTNVTLKLFLQPLKNL